MRVLLRTASQWSSAKRTDSPAQLGLKSGSGWAENIRAACALRGALDFHMPQNRLNSTRLDGVATLFGLFGDDWGHIHELVGVSLHGDWMEAEACEELRTGMIVCVGFQAHGHVARRGVVEYCEPIAGENACYRLRIRLEARLAA